MEKKYVYFFGGGKAEGGEEKRDLLGGKGASLAEMVNLGIPVPPGFTITTEVCTYYYQNNMKLPEGLEEEVRENIKKVEELMGAKFGDPERPLLFSVRSGARVSMPGMMDTVLNLGLNDKTVEGLARLTGNEWFAWDCYRRFVQMYGDVVLGLKPKSKDEHDPFEEVIEKKKKERGIRYDIEFTVDDLKELVREFKTLIKDRTGKDFPSDPYEQLWEAIGAVFRSWNNPRAKAYRELNNIPEDWGTAVNVQCMVFGNMGLDSATGVAFTRDPATGENLLYGEYLLNAQGEDVVAGIRTPLPLTRAQKSDPNQKSLEEEMPEIYKELVSIRNTLERHYKDMQDIEFTIQKGKLWMLQTRSGKRTAFAALKIAVDMVREGLITKEEAIMRVEPDQLNQILRPIFDPKEKEKALKSGKLLAKGLNAGPGAATGQVVFNAEDAEEWARQGKKVILVRIETSPEDIRGMNAAQGILTSRGGMTSHAALVARQMGKVCVVGCEDLEISYKERTIKVNGRVIREGDMISLDGTTGEVFEGEIKTTPSEVLQVLVEKKLKAEESKIYQDFATFMGWVDEIKSLGVYANADLPEQAEIACAFGAEGIGLCRTEHMFFEGERIDAVREMIIAENKAERERALSKLLPMQKNDFIGIFEVMKEKPVTIRTLDPPLHEFLPKEEKEIRALASKLNVSYETLIAKIEGLKEANPMLGHRGCRLGIMYPEITEMQARAIFEAACEVKKRGINVKPEIMIPLVGHVNEIALQKKIINDVAEETFRKYGSRVDYKVGTMIEVPRAALVADEIAKEAEFFSFGTNDLTQTTLGMSRDDSGKFLVYYLEKGIYPYDPFQRIDEEGVGKLMKIAVDLGRKTRSDLKIGICGEHGGEPNSVEFCHRIGLDYVSCSPFRVTIAKLAAARAKIKEKLKDLTYEG
ncbi:MAG: pyruvate, phosphate dikinase [Desulfobacterota bacterium]|nr:pyruvate, phosphate dikinase [Thermodesulfobacteriota bacterium]MDW8002547.1 pyruvate, phosphate dikinase [Deltaproteobacteria bacterium]